MSELKCRTIRESRRQRWTIMMTPCRLVLGLLVLNVVLASPPRYTRQVEPDNFDEDLEYYDDLTTDEPEIEISTVAPDEDNDPETEASLEGEEEEPKWEPEKESGHEEELPITPSLIPSGSGVPGVLFGPDTPGEEELRLRLRSGGSGDSGASGISGKIPDAREYHSGEPLGSGGSGGLGSGGSADEYLMTLFLEYLVVLSLEYLETLFLEYLVVLSLEYLGTLSLVHLETLFLGSLETLFLECPETLFPEYLETLYPEYLETLFPEYLETLFPEYLETLFPEYLETLFPEYLETLFLEPLGTFFLEILGTLALDPLGTLFLEILRNIFLEILGTLALDPLGTLFLEILRNIFLEILGTLALDPLGILFLEILRNIFLEILGTLALDPLGWPEEEIYVTVSTGPEEAFKEPVSGESGVLEPPLLPEEHVTSGPPEESEVPEEFVTIIPTLLEEEELFPTTQTLPQEGAGSTMGSGLPDPDVDVNEIEVHEGLPTCLLCTCLVGSVYCEDVKLVNVPPLSKDTTHFYARFNRITKINKSDFANMNKLKRIDLTSNAISIIEDGAFFGLPALEELVIRENSVAQLPALPVTMTLVDASHNRLGRTGIQNEAFKDMTGLLYLYLTDNGIDHIPVPLPDSLRSLHLQNNNIQMIHEDTFCKRNDLSYIRRALEDIRLDGNPVNLSRTPQAYVCLPRIPVGALI
ncbi:epiphycan [Ictalurus furcatus]|uniref:epiphycan n=1 Tax=Ictalurus furcatus TaxID=66913 RepID=UPI00235061F3|nr:epiphycan [Ictalurus furcatus]